MKQTLVILTLLALGGCRSEIDRTELVNPLVGSGGHGHVFVGASVPHGMVAVGPNNVSQGWDWCSGYHDSDRTIAGFAQNHLSGTGIADLGEIVVMPFTGAARLEKGTGADDGYAVPFDKRDETVHPGYYAVRLGSGILAELTATERTVYHRYTFPAQAVQSLLFDLESAPKSLARKGVSRGPYRTAERFDRRGLPPLGRVGPWRGGVVRRPLLEAREQRPSPCRQPFGGRTRSQR